MIKKQIAFFISGDKITQDNARPSKQRHGKGSRQAAEMARLESCISRARLFVPTLVGLRGRAKDKPFLDGEV